MKPGSPNRSRSRPLRRRSPAAKGAVVATLSCEWINGQTEGQINRLKMIKRQMYGRANFDLLRARVPITRRRNKSFHQ